MGRPTENGAAALLPFGRPAAKPSSLSDEAVVAACGFGDPGSMGTLFDRHHESVYRFLSRLLDADAWDLDDMVHVVFLEAFRSAGRFRGQSTVKSWLFGIALNVGRHHVRSEVRRRALLKACAEQTHQPGPRPDQETEQRQLMDRVEKALAGMPYKLRVVFILSDLEDLSHLEAAAVLGLPRGTVGRRLFQARQLLRSTLEDGPP